MSTNFEEWRRKEIELQKKQLTAQRVAAAAAVANTVATVHQAETLNAMHADSNAAAEAMAYHQRNLAEQQQLMVEEQRLANFWNTVLTTLPLLKEEEKTQYLTEQLLPRINGSDKARVKYVSTPWSLSKILESSNLVQFASSYTETNPSAKEFFATGKPLKEHKALWNEVKARFVDDYLASAAAKEFMGEQEGHRMIFAASLPWRELATEEQAFLPPSVRLPFDEYWLPLLIKEDEILGGVVIAIQAVQQRLKAFSLGLVQPDYKNQLIALKHDVLSKPFNVALSELIRVHGVSWSEKCSGMPH